MKFIEKEKTDVKAIFEIHFEEADMKEYKEKSMESLAKKIDIPGFRKGSVSNEMVVDRFGEEGVLYEIHNAFMPEIVSKMITSNKLFPISTPKVDIIKNDPIVYKVEIEILPAVELKEYDSLKIVAKSKKVESADVEEVLTQLQDQVAHFHKVDRKSKEGDQLTIDFDGKNPKGERFPGMKAEGHQIVLGSKAFVDTFEKQLEGLSVGDEKDVKVTFPENYGKTELANKPFIFTVKIHEIAEKHETELNEDFVEQITGKKESVDFLKKDIEKNLQVRNDQESKRDAEMAFLTSVEQYASFDLPNALVDDEAQQFVDNIKMQGLQQGIPWEKYLETMKKTEDDIKKEVRGDAEKRVRQRLIIDAMLQKEKIGVDASIVVKESEIQLSRLNEEQQKEQEKEFAKGGKKYHHIEYMIKIDTLLRKYIDYSALTAG